MSISEVFHIIFLIAISFVLFGFFPAILSIVAGVAAIVTAIAKLTKN